MFNRNTVMLVAGGAFFALSAASAQKPTSSRRIPVSKEAPGEVAPPRVDTVTVYRTDTLRMRGRTDTVTMTNTVTRYDTVTQSVPMVTRHIGGLYFGLGGGVALPYGSIRTVNEPGEYGQINVGWQGLNSPLGVRLDGTFNKYARNPQYGTIPFGDRVSMMGLNGDVRLNLPFFNATLGSSVRFKPYLIGGGSYVRYSNLRMKLDADGVVGNPGGFGPEHAVIAVDGGGSTVATSDWHGDWGFNFGGGLSFHAGKKEMFFESRGIRFTHDGSANSTNAKSFHAAYNVPIAFGVNFF
jgi:hypothetical protein